MDCGSTGFKKGQKWPFSHFSAIFSPVEPKSIFRPLFSLFRAGVPIWGLYRASGSQHKPKLLSPDNIFRWGRGLPHERVGAKKFGMSLETREITFFWRDIPGFCWDIPAVPEKFEKKSLCSIFAFLCPCPI